MVNKPNASEQHALKRTRSSYTCRRNKASFSSRNQHGSEWLSQQGLNPRGRFSATSQTAKKSHPPLISQAIRCQLYSPSFMLHNIRCTDVIPPTGSHNIFMLHARPI
ncbi:hypothetical protein Nepgr_022784 [Nepenthes gracilis]|uniref:Uncharacterized protein n=1 Tax=Nepenthes gracilis TaxID=150966 RepID=A0AAD3T2P8_NEPGR|nr:hypothetical protein Nepgr_022784 [Nepenthes gracilis]